MLKICIIVLLGGVVSEIVHQKCMTNSECGQDQCCNNYHGPLIASKRRDLGSLLGMQALPQEGVCEKYLPKDSYCSSIATMNGHCGCNIHHGLSCQFFPASTTTASIIKRSMVAPWVGTYKCAELLLSR